MKKKIQITIDETMWEWFKIQSDIYGVSLSGLINISMAEYRLQKETIGNIPKMMELMNIAMHEQTKDNGGLKNEMVKK